MTGAIAGLCKVLAVIRAIREAAEEERRVLYGDPTKTPPRGVIYADEGSADDR